MGGIWPTALSERSHYDGPEIYNSELEISPCTLDLLEIFHNRFSRFIKKGAPITSNKITFAVI